MSMFGKVKLGIRSKIYVASLVIVMMLLLSGVMAFSGHRDDASAFGGHGLF